MLIKPPLFLVLAFFGGFLLSIYNIYRVLAHPKKVRKESSKWALKLPDWYLLRKQIIKYSGRLATSGDLIFMIFISLVMLLATAFLFVAWFTGS